MLKSRIQSAMAATLLGAGVAGLPAGPLVAQDEATLSPAPKLRVAVLDLSGSALKMQQTQMPVPAPAGGYG